MKRIILLTFAGAAAWAMFHRHSDRPERLHVGEPSYVVQDDGRRVIRLGRSDVTIVADAEDDEPGDFAPPPPSAEKARKLARRAEAEARKAIARASRKVAEAARARPETGPESIHVVVGSLSSTEDRARADARAKLAKDAASWIGPDLADGWSRLGREVDRLVRETRVEPVATDIKIPGITAEEATLYRATIRADFSPARRRAILDGHRREQVGTRLVKLGGGLAFSLVCLAATAAYIRADEATRGYYTRRLRLAAAVGVGAAGMALYRALA